MQYRIAINVPLAGGILPGILVVDKDADGHVHFMALQCAQLGTAANAPAIRTILVAYGRNYLANHLVEISARCKNGN